MVIEAYKREIPSLKTGGSITQNITSLLLNDFIQLHGSVRLFGLQLCKSILTHFHKSERLETW